jgi:hypothetical protein
VVTIYHVPNLVHLVLSKLGPVQTFFLGVVVPSNLNLRKPSTVFHQPPSLSAPMQVNTRSRARISALSNRPPPPGSDLTDIKDAKAMEEAMISTIITLTGSRGANSEPELSDDHASASSAAEEQSGPEETEAEDSEEDNCEYSAYHGSDSEVSLNSSKKRCTRSTKGGNHKAPPQSESVNPLPALLSTP